MKNRLYLLITLLVLSGCLEQSSRQGFYGQISDWDIIYVPIVQPIRAYNLHDMWNIEGRSIHQGFSISDGKMTTYGGNISNLYSFGVSNNYVYGSILDSPGKRKGKKAKISYWFLYNMDNELYADYYTKEELVNSLKYLGIDIQPIRTCDDYFSDLADGKICYWFPNVDEKYPIYEEIIPTTPIEINIEGDTNGIDFKVGDINKHESGIYFFKLNYNVKDNKLFHISINHSRLKLIENEKIISAFIDQDSTDITVYIPYPIGQENRIKEEDRIVLTKSFKLKK